VSLWQYRYTASAMGQQEENLSRVAAIVADDTVESLIYYGFHYQEGNEDGNQLLQLRYQLSWQVSS
jgi:hypothetical protein